MFITRHFETEENFRFDTNPASRRQFHVNPKHGVFPERGRHQNEKIISTGGSFLSPPPPTFVGSDNLVDFWGENEGTRQLKKELPFFSVRTKSQLDMLPAR